MGDVAAMQMCFQSEPNKANGHCIDLCHAGEHEIEQGNSGSYSLIDV